MRLYLTHLKNSWMLDVFGIRFYFGKGHGNESLNGQWPCWGYSKGWKFLGSKVIAP